MVLCWDGFVMGRWFSKASTSDQFCSWMDCNTSGSSNVALSRLHKLVHKWIARRRFREIFRQTHGDGSKLIQKRPGAIGSLRMVWIRSTVLKLSAPRSCLHAGVDVNMKMWNIRMRNSYRIHTEFMWNSYRIHVKFIQNSCEILGGARKLHKFPDAWLRIGWRLRRSSCSSPKT